MPDINYEIGCCGIKELGDIQDTNSSRWCVLEAQREFRGAFLFFSDNGDDGYRQGEHLAQYIADQKLGTVTFCGRNINPNSRKELAMWVWAVNHEALKEWKA